jgi:tRNA dimethylallyltransferase
MKRLTAIMGPTCSGKTALACALVDQAPYEIISVDSVMIYRGLDIGTAKPDADTLQHYPHHLVDICDPKETYSVAQFCQDLAKAIECIHAKEKIPLLVGGTAMYFHVLQHGMHKLPESTGESKAAVQALVDAEGLEGLYQAVLAVDAPSAKKIGPTDPQRLARALEIYQLSGMPLSAHQLAKKAPSPYQLDMIRLLPDRTWLKQAIRQRLDHMLEQGFMAEVQRLYERGDLSLANNAIRSVGYRQAWDYLSGKDDYPTFVEKTYVATCQYAKRQYTWFNKMSGVAFHDAMGADYPDILALPFIQAGQ